MNLVEIIKSKPVLDFEKRAAALLDKAWNRHGGEAIQSAIAKIAAKEPFLTVFTVAADKTAGEVTKALKTLNKAVWRIPPETAVQKTEGTISFNKPDLAAIEKLVKGQIAWIKDHGSDSAAAKAVSAAFGRLWAEGKTRREIVEGLRAEFADITPEKFAERFGEKKYWQLFSQHHAVLSSSISSVSRMARTHTRYIFFARSNERTCELCGFYHNKTFEIAPAAAQYENYLRAAETGDIEAMKAARPFTTDQNSQIPTTPLHIGCRCRLLADPSSNIYRKKGLETGENGGKLQEGAESWATKYKTIEERARFAAENIGYSEEEKERLKVKSPESYRQIRRYTEGSGQINSILRNNPRSDIAPAELKQFTEITIPEIRKQIAAHNSTEDIIVYRGIKGRYGEVVEEQAANWLKTGKSIDDNGFLSTSLSKDFVKDWTKTTKLILEITVPKGTPCLYVEKLTAYPGEQEVLFLDKSRFYITSIEKDGKYKIIKGILKYE